MPAFAPTEINSPLSTKLTVGDRVRTYTTKEKRPTATPASKGTRAARLDASRDCVWDRVCSSWAFAIGYQSGPNRIGWRVVIAWYYTTTNCIETLTRYPLL